MMLVEKKDDKGTADHETVSWDGKSHFLPKKISKEATLEQQGKCCACTLTGINASDVKFPSKVNLSHTQFDGPTKNQARGHLHNVHPANMPEAITCNNAVAFDFCGSVLHSAAGVALPLADLLAQLSAVNGWCLSFEFVVSPHPAFAGLFAILLFGQGVSSPRSSSCWHPPFVGRLQHTEQSKSNPCFDQKTTTGQVPDIAAFTRDRGHFVSINTPNLLCQFKEFCHEIKCKSLWH